jgi:hypothetical protein
LVLEFPVAGTATFSSATAGGPLNRLQLAVSSISFASLQISGCGSLGTALDALAAFIPPTLQVYITNVMSQQFCGAVGPELFGPSP